MCMTSATYKRLHVVEQRLLAIMSGILSMYLYLHLCGALAMHLYLHLSGVLTTPTHASEAAMRPHRRRNDLGTVSRHL